MAHMYFKSKLVKQYFCSECRTEVTIDTPYRYCYCPHCGVEFDVKEGVA